MEIRVLSLNYGIDSSNTIITADIILNSSDASGNTINSNIKFTKDELDIGSTTPTELINQAKAKLTNLISNATTSAPEKPVETTETLEG